MPEFGPGGIFSLFFVEILVGHLGALQQVRAFSILVVKLACACFPGWAAGISHLGVTSTGSFWASPGLFYPRGF